MLKLNEFRHKPSPLWDENVGEIYSTWIFGLIVATLYFNANIRIVRAAARK